MSRKSRPLSGNKFLSKKGFAGCVVEASEVIAFFISPHAGMERLRNPMRCA